MTWRGKNVYAPRMMTDITEHTNKKEEESPGIKRDFLPFLFRQLRRSRPRISSSPSREAAIMAKAQPLPSSPVLGGAVGEGGSVGAGLAVGIGLAVGTGLAVGAGLAVGDGVSVGAAVSARFTITAPRAS